MKSVLDEAGFCVSNPARIIIDTSIDLLDCKTTIDIEHQNV